MALKRAQGSRLFCSKARPMAAGICYVKRAKVGPSGETHAPGKKARKNAHDEDEPVTTQKDDTDHVDEGEDDHMGEGEDEVDEGEDDHTSEGEDDVDEVEHDHTSKREDDVDEGEDDHASEGEDDVDEGEDDVDEGEDNHASEGEDDASEGEDDVDEGEDNHASEGEDDHASEGEDDVDEGEHDHASEGEDDADEVEDDHASEVEDDHTGEGEDDVDEGEDDHMGGEREEDVDEGEDDQMGEGEDHIEEGEDEDIQEEDGGGDYVQTTSEPLKEDHYVGPLETFTVTVQGTCLDPFIPTSMKARYWALCSSRGAILHSRLHLHYLPKAAAAAVASVVELADKIWAATPDLPISTFDGWIADAKELEAAGLDVSFMRERIEQLRAFVSGKQGQPLIEQNKVRWRYAAITRELRDMEGQIGWLMRRKEELGRLKHEVAALLPDLWPRAEACWDAFAELVAASW